MSPSAADQLATLGTLVLAGALLWAAAAKATDRPGTAARLRLLGFSRTSRPLSTLLPATEAAVAVTLLTNPVRGGAVATVLLVGFTVVLGVLMVRGEPIGCGCFGSGHDEPTGPRDVLRNLGLIAAALGATTLDEGLVRPDVAAVVTATAALVVVAVLDGLWRIRSTTGWVWRLPAEVRA